MDVSSMMKALQAHDAPKRVANGVGVSRGNGMLTSATATTGAGKMVAAKASGAAATGPAAGTAGASSSSSSSSDTSDITSSDFLTLLVAEMQNQDPTQPTDPNTYIQQLVGVNSLQQLISINGELGQVTGSTGTSSGGSVTNPITPPVVSGGVPSGG
jgi:flagellar basal-body rod modification protein FlgD